MKHVNGRRTGSGRLLYTLKKEDLQLLYSDVSFAAKQEVLTQLGPLEPTFTRFVIKEQHLQPLDLKDLITRFEACSDPERSADDLSSLLWELAPGNGRIGFRQVNFMVDQLRTKVFNFLRQGGHQLGLVPHDHAFGSGGDFWKTGHATTNASIIVAPVLRICKTGTTHVTAEHGSYQATQQIGYRKTDLNIRRLNEELITYGFSFVPLSSLGFPYSDSLKMARKRLWSEAMQILSREFSSRAKTWQDVVRTTEIPLDIFKIISPNAQVLNPIHHSTGVYHLDLIPYTLAIYLYLGSVGFIMHCYDGIDELSNASSDPTAGSPNNLLVQVTSKQIRIIEVAPEDLDFARATLKDIEEKKNLKEDANTFWEILIGSRKGPTRDFVVMNAAVLLVAGQKASTEGDDLIAQLRAAVQVAEYLIDSGRSYDNFRRLLVSQTLV